MRKKLFRSSPMSSPSKERYGDRFIPVRSGNNWETNFSSIPVSAHFVSIYLLFNENIYIRKWLILSGILMFIPKAIFEHC